MSSWNELFKDKDFRWREPDSEVVRVVDIMKRKGVRRVYDLGCGAGRHTVYLARQEFEVFASDISEEGLRHTKEWLRRENLGAEVIKSDMTVIPYPESFFDGIISFHTIYHNKLHLIEKTIAEIRRTLRVGGLVFVTLQSTSDHKFGLGDQIEQFTFIPGVGPDGDIPHHFFDEERARSLFKDFSIIECEEKERSYGVRSREIVRGVHWFILARKD